MAMRQYVYLAIAITTTLLLLLAAFLLILLSYFRGEQNRVYTALRLRMLEAELSVLVEAIDDLMENNNRDEEQRSRYENGFVSVALRDDDGQLQAGERGGYHGQIYSPGVNHASPWSTIHPTPRNTFNLHPRVLVQRKSAHDRPLNTAEDFAPSTLILGHPVNQSNIRDLDIDPATNHRGTANNSDIPRPYSNAPEIIVNIDPPRSDTTSPSPSSHPYHPLISTSSSSSNLSGHTLIETSVEGPALLQYNLSGDTLVSYQGSDSDDATLTEDGDQLYSLQILSNTLV